jgi:beta-exotoxin I transport system ATP-binding protein
LAPAAIRTDALTKYYGAVIGVEGLSLEVSQGEVFGFLGANGAGKTTTIRMLLDLVRPTSGSASVLGLDCQHRGIEARAQIGYLPGEMPVYPELTGARYLSFLGSLGSRRVSPSRLEFLLRRFDVSDLDLQRRMRDYSHGMKRKLGLIQALMTDAPLLILDEPTSGLDPLMIEAFSDTIDELRKTGKTTIFMSSHILAEVDRVCERIGLVRHGRLVAVRTLAELRSQAPRRMTVSFAAPVPIEPSAIPGVSLVAHEPGRWVIDVHGPAGPLMFALNGLPVADLTMTPFTLDETILRLLGEQR